MKIKEMEYGKERRTELLCKDKYKNYNYYVLNLGTHPTAYIEIPKEDKLYGKSYDGIYRIGCDIDVNGGLTYSDNELMGIKSENWFIGWDYAHCNDYCGYEEDMPENIRTYGKKWTTEEIIEECKNAIDQIIDFESEEIEEEKKTPTLNDIRESYGLPRIEEKKIPKKLPYYSLEKIQKAKNKDEWLEERISLLEKRVEDLHIKMNELLDYLKSKGE